MMSETGGRSTRGDPHGPDVQVLHRLLNRLHRDEATLVVVDVVWLGHRHRVVGRLSDGADYVAPFEPVVIRCGSGERSIRAGMRLRLWRDATGANLEQCIP